MNTGLAIVAGVLIALALLCVYFVRKYRGEIALMAATETSRCADIATTAPGTLVELKGTIRCAAPIVGEYSGRPGVWARMEITREETETRDGRRETTSYPESSRTETAPFEVEDASGRVRIDSDGANVEAQESYNQYRSSLGGDVVALATSLLGARNMSYKYRELLLPADIAVYILGEVLPGGGVGRAGKGNAHREFIISYKSEEERTSSTKTTIVILYVVTGLLLAGAAALLWWGAHYNG